MSLDRLEVLRKNEAELFSRVYENAEGIISRRESANYGLNARYMMARIMVADAEGRNKDKLDYINTISYLAKTRGKQVRAALGLPQRRQRDELAVEISNIVRSSWREI